MSSLRHCGLFIISFINDAYVVCTSLTLFLRDRKEQPHILRVEIVLHGATYYVTFLDADTFPHPIRLENCSDVPILYKQKGCSESYLHTILSPRTEG